MTAISPSKPLSEPRTGRWNRLDSILFLLLALGTLAVYLQTRHFGFIEYDDHLYVFRNQHVLDGLSLKSLRWAITSDIAGNWHPLTMIVELVLSSLFGPSPATFHVTNSFLHVLNVLLLYTFLRKSTGQVWPCFFVAGLWGLHPLRVESVAWISELKDVLCGSFWLGCMLAYLHYSRRRTPGGYALVLALLTLALLSKPMAGTLPAILLLLDFWPIRSDLPENKTVSWWGARVLEKIPLLLVCGADLGYALVTQRHFTSSLTSSFSLDLRCRNAAVAIVSYLRDLFFPYHLSLFYPHPGLTDQTIPLSEVIPALALLLAITIVALVRWRKQPYLIVGWLWFLGALSPVVGIVSLGEASRANRYTYLPSIGITIAVVWLISDWVYPRRLLRIVAVVLGFAAMGIAATATSGFVEKWKDSPTLFHYMLEIQPNNPLALTYRANELWKQGHPDEGLLEARRAVAASPKSAAGHIACALALQAAKKYPQAVDEFAVGIRLTNADDDYWDGLGNVRALQAEEFAQKHDPQEKAYREKAIVDYRTALTLNSEATDSREHLAFQLAALGRIDEAISEWQQLLDLSPNDAQAQGDLADALRLKQDLPGAVEHYRAALAAGSKNPGWETELAYLVATNPQATANDVQPMVAIAKDACDQSQDRSAAALDAYAACLARVGRFDDAVTAVTQGIAQANADHEPAVAAGMRKRQALYQQQLPYVVSDSAGASTQPTTTPS